MSSDSTASGYGTSRYLRGMIWSSGGMVLSIATAMLTVYVAVRMISKEEFGAYGFALLLAQLGATFGDFGLRSAAIRFLNRSQAEDRDNLACHFLTLRIIMVAVTCLLACVAVPISNWLWPSPELRSVIWYIVPCVGSMLLYQMGLALLVGYGSFAGMSGTMALIEVVRFVLSIAFLYSGCGVAGLLLGMISSRVVGIAVLARMLPFRYKFTAWHALRGEVIRFGGWLQAAAVLSVINIRIGETILTMLLGVGELGTYTAGAQIPRNCQRMFEAVRPIVLAYVSSSRADAATSIVLSVRLLAAILTICATAMIVLAEWLMTVLFPEEYASAVPVMRVLSFWLVCTIINYYLAITLMGMGRTFAVFVLNVPQLLLVVGGNVLLTRPFQSLGAAFALAVAGFLGACVSAWIVCEGDWRYFGRISWAWLRASIPLGMLVVYDSVYGLSSISMVLAGGAVVAALAVLRCITLGDMRRLLRATLSKS